MSRNRIVLFVEGAGDVQAAPVLIKRLITERNAWEFADLDPHPFEIKGLHNLVGTKKSNWVAKLKAAALRRNTGAVILLLDGDTKHYESKPFCAFTVASDLTSAAKEAGAGSTFSVAVVFACSEYESWLIAGSKSIAGRVLPDGRPGLRADILPPETDLEASPRDAKKWLSKAMAGGYSPPLDQKPLTEMIDLDALRARKMRSFQRLESAVDKIVDALKQGAHIVSPSQS